MQLVTAIVRPHSVEAVKEALTSAGVSGLTISEVRGFGRQGGQTETYRGTEYQIDLIPKAKVEVLVDESEADAVVAAIAGAAQTGKIGDGKIWVTEVGRTVRIRTGEQGADAL